MDAVADHNRNDLSDCHSSVWDSTVLGWSASARAGLGWHYTAKKKNISFKSYYYFKSNF